MLTLEQLLEMFANVSWVLYVVTIAIAFYMSLRARHLSAPSRKILEALANRKLNF